MARPVMLVVAAAMVWAASAFDVGIYETEGDALGALRRSLQDENFAITAAEHGDDVDAAMARGWWDLAAELVGAGSAKYGVDFTGAVHARAADIRRALTRLTERLAKGGASVMQDISPAFEWAESPTSVFLNVKFSAKWDTPATLGCEADNGTVEEPRRFLLSASCVQARKRFRLGLQLRGAIDPMGAAVATAAVGRATVTLRKAKPGVWGKLLAAGAKAPHMHVWWALAERHEAENKAFGVNGTKSNGTATASAPADEEATATLTADAPGDAAPLVAGPTSSAGVAAEGAAPEAPAAAAAVSATDNADSPYEVARAVAQAKAALARRAADDAQAAAAAEAAATGRARKRAIDEAAAAEKTSVDKDVASARAAGAATAAAARAAADEELRSTLASLAAQYDVSGADDDGDSEAPGVMERLRRAIGA